MGEKNIFVRGNRPREKTKKRGWLTGCELSLLLFDPVPGDLLTIAQLDLLRLTNTTASFACLHSCKLTNRHGKSTILMVFTRKNGDFHGLC